MDRAPLRALRHAAGILPAMLLGRPSPARPAPRQIPPATAATRADEPAPSASPVAPAAVALAAPHVTPVRRRVRHVAQIVNVIAIVACALVVAGVAFLIRHDGPSAVQETLADCLAAGTACEGADALALGPPQATSAAETQTPRAIELLPPVVEYPVGPPVRAATAGATENEVAAAGVSPEANGAPANTSASETSEPSPLRELGVPGGVPSGSGQDKTVEPPPDPKECPPGHERATPEPKATATPDDERDDEIDDEERQAPRRTCTPRDERPAR